MTVKEKEMTVSGQKITDQSKYNLYHWSKEPYCGIEKIFEERTEETFPKTSKN